MISDMRIGCNLKKSLDKFKMNEAMILMRKLEADIVTRLILMDDC